MSDLTIKQRKWLKRYIEIGNATKAAMEVYDCKDERTASTIGWENIRKLDIKQAMEEAGLTDAKLLEVHKAGLEADFVTKTGEVVPHHGVRHKYLETAYKLKGYVSDKGGGGININEAKILVIPNELASKYGVSPDTGDSSQG